MGAEDEKGGGIWDALWQGPMALYRIRFGSGVLGRLTTNLIVIFSVFGAAALVSLIFGHTWIAVTCLAFCGVWAIVNHASTLVFAYQHPVEALLEGADLVRVREIEMARKGLPYPDAQTNIEPPMIEAVGTDAEAVQLEHKVGSVSD